MKEKNMVCIRLDKDLYPYAKKIKRRYNHSKKYSFNRLINHLLRQHISTEKKEGVYHLKIEILDLAKQKEEISEEMRIKQILYEAKKQKQNDEEIEKRIRNTKQLLQ